jgi:hypothetical protein
VEEEEVCRFQEPRAVLRPPNARAVRIESSAGLRAVGAVVIVIFHTSSPALSSASQRSGLPRIHAANRPESIQRCHHSQPCTTTAGDEMRKRDVLRLAVSQCAGVIVHRRRRGRRYRLPSPRALFPVMPPRLPAAVDGPTGLMSRQIARSVWWTTV